MHEHVAVHHADFAPIFESFGRHIMRVDVFRYILMFDFGGLYCDLDYEFLRPFDYGDAQVVLSLELQTAYGDGSDGVANYVFASVPGHDLWADILEDLRRNPPRTQAAADVCCATGPGLVSRIALDPSARYRDMWLTDKPMLSPRRVHGRHETKHYLNSDNIYGFHHGWGSWKQRLSFPYVGQKLKKCGRYLLRPHL